MAAICIGPLANAQNSNFHNAPPSTKEMVNPDANDPKAAAAGQPLYHLRCARCHGERGEGSGNIPSIAKGKVQSVSDGELFWFITKGDVPNGMPSWASLPRHQRWHITSYVKALGTAKITASGPTGSAKEPANETVPNLPAPKPPFTDFRFEKPETSARSLGVICPHHFLHRRQVTGRRWWLARTARGLKFQKGLKWACMPQDSMSHD